MILPNITYKGKVSHFGGPLDEGVSVSEGLALFQPGDELTYTELFLPRQPPGTTGLARRLDPSSLYCACRWSYQHTSKSILRGSIVRINKVGVNRFCMARPSDWGPAEYTNRIIDVSPGVMKALNLQTDDEVEICLFLNSVA